MQAVTNAKIYTMAGTVIDCGTVLWQDGIIIDVGKHIAIPNGTVILDAKGETLVPGLINAHSQAGLRESYIDYVAGDDSNETAFPLTPQLNSLHGINANDDIFDKMLYSGITTVAVAPGNINLLGGSITAIKTLGNTIDEMVIKEHVGVKASMGYAPKHFYSNKMMPPITRINIMAMLRQALYAARDYAFAKEGSKLPYNLLAESLLPVLAGEVPLFINANRRDDIYSALRLAKEFNLKIVLVNATEAYLIADKLSLENVSCIISPGIKLLNSLELQYDNWCAPSKLLKSGVTTAVVTDSDCIAGNELSTWAIMMRKTGIPLQQVLEVLTINAAKILGIDNKVGSIEKGKDADFVLYNNEPFTIQNQISKVFINGQIVNKGGLLRCC